MGFMLLEGSPPSTLEGNFVEASLPRPLKESRKLPQRLSARPQAFPVPRYSGYPPPPHAV